MLYLHVTQLFESKMLDWEDCNLPIAYSPALYSLQNAYLPCENENRDITFKQNINISLLYMFVKFDINVHYFFVKIFRLRIRGSCPHVAHHLGFYGSRNFFEIFFRMHTLARNFVPCLQSLTHSAELCPMSPISTHFTFATQTPFIGIFHTMYIPQMPDLLSDHSQASLQVVCMFGSIRSPSESDKIDIYSTRYLLTFVGTVPLAVEVC